MDFSKYQQVAIGTAIYPNVGGNLNYPALGLASEAGEVCGKVKRVMRDLGGALDDDTRQAIATELGDVLWYVAMTAHEVGVDLNDVASWNVIKLLSRKERGRLGGEGDLR